MPAPDPAVELASEDEARAMRIAVTYALRQGLASDDLETRHPCNRSLISLGRKLGCRIPDWCDVGERVVTRAEAPHAA